MSAATDRQADPGLQPQRTALAWSRTGLVMLVDALLVLRAGLHGGDRVVLALAVLLGVSSAAFWGLGAWRRSALMRAQFAAVPAAAMGSAAGLVVLAAVAALLSFSLPLWGKAGMGA